MSAAPTNAFVMTLEVPDCDGYVERALADGGSVALPAEDMAGIGRLAYIMDPDGNVLRLLQSETPRAGGRLSIVATTRDLPPEGDSV